MFTPTKNAITPQNPNYAPPRVQVKGTLTFSPEGNAVTTPPSDETKAKKNLLSYYGSDSNKPGEMSAITQRMSRVKVSS